MNRYQVRITQYNSGKEIMAAFDVPIFADSSIDAIRKSTLFMIEEYPIVTTHIEKVN